MIEFRVYSILQLDNPDFVPEPHLIPIKVDAVNDAPLISSSWPWSDKLGAFGTTLKEKAKVMLSVNLFDLDIARGEGSDSTMMVVIIVEKGENGGRLQFSELLDESKVTQNQFVNVKGGKIVNSIKIAFLAPLTDANRVLSQIEYSAPENPGTVKDTVQIIVDDLGNFGKAYEPQRTELLLQVNDCLVDCLFG